MVRGVEGKSLLEYPWSSLPAYLFKQKRPAWLTVERGFASLGLADTAPQRREYLKDLESRVEEERGGRENDGRKTLRFALSRGWYFGSDAFRDWLLSHGSAVLERHKSSGQNYHGPEMSDHGILRARQILAESLNKACLDISDLKARRKSDPLKAEIAVAIRRSTTVPLRWIAEELVMGSPMNVSRLTAPLW